MNILITGISGFVGSHLAEYALAQGATVYGICRGSNLDNILHIKDKIKLHICNLVYNGDTTDLISKLPKLDYVFHLAAQSFVPSSWSAPSATMEANAIGQIHLLEALRAAKQNPTVQIACSSEQYGCMSQDVHMIDENHPMRPLSPYGVSKITQEYTAIQYNATYGMRIVVTRAFNHTGPRRSPQFVLSSFAKQIAEAEKDSKLSTISVGNLTAHRDFTDVRDMVKAYWCAVQRAPVATPLNIASGEAHQISDLLDKLVTISGTDIQVCPDPSRMRPSDLMYLRGDSTKFRSLTGWEPEIPIEQTLSDLLDYWRERV